MRLTAPFALLSVALTACPDDPGLTTDGTTAVAPGTSTTGATATTADPTTGPGTSTTLPPPASTTTADTSGSDDSSTTTGDDSSSTGGSSGTDSSSTGGESTGSSSTGSGSTDSSNTWSSSTDSSNTGSSSTDSSSTGGDSTTSTTTGGDSTTTGTSTGDDTSTGDTGGEEVEEYACPYLMRSHVGMAGTAHAGARFATHDKGGHLALWDTASGERLATFTGVDSFELIADTLVYRTGGQIHVVDAADASELTTCPSSAQWGIATDGSYLWTAGDDGLDLLELDCGLRWSTPGALADARVLAVPDGVHVFDADLMAQGVVHFDAVDGASTSDAFLGSFTAWFVDVPRYWTTQGNATRVYDVDNTVLQLGADIVHGAGQRMVGYYSVRDVFTGQFIAQLGSIRSYDGSVVITRGDNLPLRLIHIDKDPAQAIELISAPCCLTNLASFAYNNGAWVVADDRGGVGDHLQRRLSPGRVDGITGGVAGRVTIGTNDREVRVQDVAGLCDVTYYPPFTRNITGKLWGSSDGARVLTADFFDDPNSTLGYHGTTHYNLPDGAPLAHTKTGLHSDFVGEHDVSDNNEMWTRMVINSSYVASVSYLGSSIAQSTSHVLPKLGPDSEHFCTTDAHYSAGGWQTAHAYIYTSSPKALVGVADGVPHGFIDDEHVLVGHYTGSPNTFIGSDIVGLDGITVQPTTLPDIHHFTRVATGEIVAIVEPDDHPAIFDPWTGQQLWSGPKYSTAVVAGLDLIAVSDGADVELIKWR